MKSPHLVEGIDLTPIGAAAVELRTCRGYDLHDAVEMLEDKFVEDCAVPVSGLFNAGAVVKFYADRGEEVNAVPLPRTRGGRQGR